MKCDPEQALLWREEFESVSPGWHQNKKHWNSVFIDNSIDDSKLQEMILHAYKTVVKGLSKKLQNELNND